MVYDPLKAGSIDGTDKEPHDKAIIRAMNATYKCNHSVKGVPERTVFVARLNRRTTEKTLRSVRINSVVINYCTEITLQFITFGGTFFLFR